MNMSDIISQKETYLQSAFIAVAACGIMKILFAQIFLMKLINPKHEDKRHFSSN